MKLDDSNRSAIPADLRRKVLVEAGHRCAIPTCRYIQVEIHHIIPWAQCKAHEYDNLIALCPNCHRRADNDEIDRKSLKLYKYNLRFIYDKFSQLEMDVLFELSHLPKGHGLPWLRFNDLLLKRLFDSKYIDFYEIDSSISIYSDVAMGSIKTTPDAILITDEGRQFINDISNREL